FVKFSFAKAFQREFLAALNLFDENQYLRAFEKYLKHVVAFVKNEKIKNEITGKSEEPSETIMGEVEGLLAASGEKREAREKIVAKIASWRVENPKGELEISKVFQTELASISKRIYESKQADLEVVKNGMLMYGSEDYDKL